MFVKIKGVQVSSLIGAYASRPQDIAELFSGSMDAKELRRLQRGTGFKKLRLARQGMVSSDFCVAAARELMQRERMKRENIDGLVMVTQCPDYLTPATSHVMQDRLQLRQDIVALDLTQGCSGYVYGLYTASLLVQSGSCQRVLLCVGESDGRGGVSSGEKSTAVLFGQGGSACVVERGEGDIYFGFKVYGARHKMLITKRSGFRYPRISPYDPAATPEKLRENESHMDGMGIMQFSLNDVPADIQHFLHMCGRNAGEIGLFAVHQANKMIVRSLADLLGVPHECVPFTAGEIGNLSSASIPVMLAEWDGAAEDMQLTCLCGYGVGLSVGCALLDLSQTHRLGAIEL